MKPLISIYLARTLIVAVSLWAWFASQSLLSLREFPQGIGDRAHLLLAPATDWFQSHPRAADSVLIITSGIIDLLGCFLLGSGIFGRSVEPFLGLMTLFILRQLSQLIVSLPPPEGMIWRYPGFPSLFVTYNTANDFFFSGHTAIAVYGAIELAKLNTPWLTFVGAAVAVIEALTVLALRAHYTMDVFAAILAAALAASAAPLIAPPCDRALARLWYVVEKSYGR